MVLKINGNYKGYRTFEVLLFLIQNRWKYRVGSIGLVVPGDVGKVFTNNGWMKVMV